MNEGLIARRYALAILKVAQKENAAGEVYEVVKQFEQNYVAHPGLHKALVNPVVSTRDKESLIVAALGLEHPGELYLRGIRLLIANHREMYIRLIGLMYQKLYREVYRIGRVKIISAVKLDNKTLERVKRLAMQEGDYSTLEFVEQTDPALIGGFIVRIGSRQLDFSVGGELRKLAKEFTQ